MQKAFQKEGLFIFNPLKPHHNPFTGWGFTGGGALFDVFLEEFPGFLSREVIGISDA